MHCVPQDVAAHREMLPLEHPRMPPISVEPRFDIGQRHPLPVQRPKPLVAAKAMTEQRVRGLVDWIPQEEIHGQQPRQVGEFLLLRPFDEYHW